MPRWRGVRRHYESPVTARLAPIPGVDLNHAGAWVLRSYTLDGRGRHVGSAFGARERRLLGEDGLQAFRSCDGESQGLKHSDRGGREVLNP